ncbi:MAG: hypothetical protein QM733_03965 [Ilumatobacteraceae bacterium]
MLDVEDDLALDEQVVGERQLVLAEVDGTLDRVLDGDEPESSTSPTSTASSTSGIVRYSTSSASARSLWVASAASVNVPRGPRIPIRRVVATQSMPGRLGGF